MISLTKWTGPIAELFHGKNILEYACIDFFDGT